jgi:hypothetical protein
MVVNFMDRPRSPGGRRSGGTLPAPSEGMALLLLFALLYCLEAFGLWHGGAALTR